MTELGAYLTALSQGDDLYELTSRQARLWHDQALRPHAEVDRSAYAAGIDALRAPADRPLARFEVVEMLSETPEGADAKVVWARGVERVLEREVIIGAGLRREDGAWRVAWCTLADTPQPWSMAIGEAQALSEFAVRTLKHPARAAIDVAYERLHRLDRPNLVTLPGARFSCHGSGTCCRCDYAINVGAHAQAFIDAIPWEQIRPDLAGTKLEPLPDGRLKLKARNERCRFLDDQERCVIHQALGRPVFGPCTVFPFSFAWTPEGVAVSASGVCSSVRGGLGPELQERAEDLHRRLYMYNLPHPNRFLLAPGVEIPWEAFQHVEDTLLAILGAAELPLHRRLWAGCRYLEQILAGRGWQADVALATEPIPEASPEDRADLEGLQAYLAGLPRAFTKDLADRPVPPARHDGLRSPETLAQVLQNLLFGKSFSYKYDLLTAFHVLVILYLHALTLQGYFPEALPVELWEELGMLGFHGPLEHQLFPEGVDGGHQMRRIVGTPGYGLGLLRAMG